MPFTSGELKFLYELLIDLGHPITASEAGRLFRAGELADYVQAILDAQLPPACAPGDIRCEKYDLYACQEVLGSPQWVLVDKNSQFCGYVPEPPPAEIKKEGIRLYQARLDAWSIWQQLVKEFEYYRDAVSALTVEWFYATKQYNKYRALRYEWTEALDNYWRNKWEIEGLQDDLDDLRASLDGFYTLISGLYTELLELQEDIDWKEYIVEMYQDSVDYWRNKYDQLGLDWYNCMVANAWYGPACQDIADEMAEAKELLELAQDHLDEAQAELARLEQLKWYLLDEVDIAWAWIADLQGQIADIEDQIEDLLGVLADYDTIIEQIEKFDALVDYWKSEVWRLEDQLEYAYIRVEAAAHRADAAEDEWDIARRAWSRFKKEYPEIAQEILDEW